MDNVLRDFDIFITHTVDRCYSNRHRPKGIARRTYGHSGVVGGRWSDKKEHHKRDGRTDV